MAGQVVARISDLEKQQKLIGGGAYDLRVSNLAAYLNRNIIVHPGTFLDVGAGNGLILKYFKKRGYAVSGVEIDGELASILKKDPELKSVKIVQTDINRLKPSASFDYVLASDVIEHIKDDDLAIRNLFGFVKPGGMLVLTVPAHTFLYGRRDRLWGHFRRYDADTLIPKLQRLEGEIVYVSHWNILGMIFFFFSEKILHRVPSETLRHSHSPVAVLVRFIVGLELRLESLIGRQPFGLTLITAVRKNS